jgi:hypothetical protein
LADRYTARSFGPERRTAEGSKVFSSDIDDRIGRPFKLVKVDNQSPNSLARSVPQEINREIAEVE